MKKSPQASLVPAKAEKTFSAPASTLRSGPVGEIGPVRGRSEQTRFGPEFEAHERVVVGEFVAEADVHAERAREDELPVEPDERKVGAFEGGHARLGEEVLEVLRRTVPDCTIRSKT